MINFPLLKRQALRLVTGSKTYEELCDRQWVLSPEKSAIAQSAIYLNGALDKITGVQSETTYATELERIRGGMRTHAPTIAYQLRNVHIRQGYVYKAAMRLRFTTQPDHLFAWDKTALIPDAAFACSDMGYRYFAHSLLDDLPLTLAAQQIAEPITTNYLPTLHQAQYQDLFEIHARPVQQAFCQRFTLIDDVGQNEFKRDRYQLMRSKLMRSKLMHSKLQAIPSKQPPRGVLLLRGKSGVKRLLVNEQEVAAFLRDQGFVCLNVETLSAQEIVQQSLGASIVVGVEGSQLVHGLLTMADGGALITLQPPYRFNNPYKDYIDCFDTGIRYGFVVGQAAPDGFEIDLHDLARTLERVDQVLACRALV
ncbi:MAG: glycosyltransferase family 61 protein [Leptolyngbyaceae cyanobacterium bins.349]|nr:glycosyltransferase family 61 protein [Leptolyngbyaceae cyanobacterium bins.349]